MPKLLIRVGTSFKENIRREAKSVNSASAMISETGLADDLEENTVSRQSAWKNEALGDQALREALYLETRAMRR